MWEKNMKMIELHNQEFNLGKQSFTMATDAFGDMTNEEFRQVVNGLQNQKHKKRKVFRELLFAGIHTPNCDLERGRLCNSVKDQGHCSSRKPADLFH